MKIDKNATLIPAEFPELALLVWNRQAMRAISASDAFAIYERNWRFVDRTRLTERETRLIGDLTETFGNGVMLAS